MEKSSFFNSVGGDRRYNAFDWASYFASFIGNGVFGSPEDCLKVVPEAAGVSVAVSIGAAWINGFHYINTARLLLTLPTPDGVLHRIDRIVACWSFDDRWIRAFVKPGAPASNPAPPALQRDSSVYELALADVSVAAGAEAILERHITDLRGDPALCGTVSSIVSEAHSHDPATQSKAGFLSANDKKVLDTLSGQVNQDLRKTASPTFQTVTAEKVVGAVYA